MLYLGKSSYKADSNYLLSKQLHNFSGLFLFQFPSPDPHFTTT